MQFIQRGTRVILAAVVPAHGDENAPLLASVTAQIEQAGGQIVGRIVQRHGVSRGKNRGGASAMKRAAPINPRTVLGTGKADELAEMVRETSAEIVVFCNPLTSTQKRALEELTAVEVQEASPPGPSPKGRGEPVCRLLLQIRQVVSFPSPTLYYKLSGTGSPFPLGEGAGGRGLLPTNCGIFPAKRRCCL